MRLPKGLRGHPEALNPRCPYAQDPSVLCAGITWSDDSSWSAPDVIRRTLAREFEPPRSRSASVAQADRSEGRREEKVEPTSSAERDELIKLRRGAPAQAGVAILSCRGLVCTTGAVCRPDLPMSTKSRPRSPSPLWRACSAPRPAFTHGVIAHHRPMRRRIPRC